MILLWTITFHTSKRGRVLLVTVLALIFATDISQHKEAYANSVEIKCNFWKKWQDYQEASHLQDLNLHFKLHQYCSCGVASLVCHINLWCLRYVKSEELEFRLSFLHPTPQNEAVSLFKYPKLKGSRMKTLIDHRNLEQSRWGCKPLLFPLESNTLRQPIKQSQVVTVS